VTLSIFRRQGGFFCEAKRKMERRKGRKSQEEEKVKQNCPNVKDSEKKSSCEKLRHLWKWGKSIIKVTRNDDYKYG
jgi:hypothetical protein